MEDSTNYMWKRGAPQVDLEQCIKCQEDKNQKLTTLTATGLKTIYDVRQYYVRQVTERQFPERF